MRRNGNALGKLASRHAGRILIACAVLASGNAPKAETLAGRVVGVSDGDTLTLLVDKRPVKIRVAGIDAPEKSQPFGRRAKMAMSTCAYGKQAEVEWTKVDLYGRAIGKVVVDGLDCGLSLISQGLAWHYKAYQREQARDDQASYAQAEIDARAGKMGLWSDENAQPPWEFRRQKKARSPN